MEWRGETEESEKKGVAKRRRNFAANQSAVRGVSQRENGRGAWAGAIQPGGLLRSCTAERNAVGEDVHQRGSGFPRLVGWMLSLVTILLYMQVAFCGIA